MSYCRMINSGTWSATAPARPPKALKMNPVKVLHSQFYEKPHLRSDIDYSMARFRLTMLLESLQGLPSCYVINYANRPAACKCMQDPALTSEVIHEAADYLRGFAMLKKEQQQSMIVEWMKYASLSREQLLGHSVESQRRVWLLPGTSFSICRNTLQRVIGYGKKGWKTCVDLSKQNRAPAGSHGLSGRTGRNANRSNSNFHDMMDSFFIDIQDLCTPRATRLVREATGQVELRDEEEELVELPPYLTKSGLYKRFVSEVAGHEIYHDAKHRVTGTLPIAGKEQKKFPSERTFIEYWNKEFPQVVPQRVRADICGDCYTFSNSHRFITGILAREEKEKQEERRDAPDEGATGDDNRDRDEQTMDAEAAETQRLVDKQESLVLKAAHHVDMARRQRDYFRDKKEEAYLDRSTAHVALEDQGKKGGNNVASMIWKQLTKEGLVPTAHQLPTHKPVKELNLFFDNCGGQNKNRMVFRMLTLIVKRKVALKASAFFLVRAHTKNDCDRIFNLMKRDYRKTNIYTPKQMYEALNQSPQVTAVQVPAFQDWNKLQDKYMKRMQAGTTNCNHVFTVDSAREDSNKIWLKEYYGADEETSQTIVKNAFLEENWWLEEPDDIEPVGIQFIKWQELYKFWRKFVPEQYHKDWKYYAEDLPEDQKKKLSTQKEESRLKRKERGRVNDAVDPSGADAASGAIV